MSKVVTQEDLFSLLRGYEERIRRLENAIFMGHATAQAPSTAEKPEDLQETGNKE